MGIIGWIGRQYFEWSAGKTTIPALKTGLTESGTAIENKLAAAEDTPANQNLICHIIGIERWGQQRLRAFLGEDFSRDEHDPYKPAPHLPLSEYQTLFRETRQTTLELADQIEAASLARETVPHNQFGDLKAKTWLFYLRGHADMESGRLK